MCTIESFEDYVDPIQEAIDDLLLPTLFGQSHLLPNEVRRLVTLTTAQGGLGMPDLTADAPQQFAASKSITTAHVDSITSQSTFMAKDLRRSLRDIISHLRGRVTKRKWKALTQLSPQICCD